MNRITVTSLIAVAALLLIPFKAQAWQHACFKNTNHGVTVEYQLNAEPAHKTKWRWDNEHSTEPRRCVDVTRVYRLGKAFSVPIRVHGKVIGGNYIFCNGKRHQFPVGKDGGRLLFEVTGGTVFDVKCQVKILQNPK